MTFQVTMDRDEDEMWCVECPAIPAGWPWWLAYQCFPPRD